MEKLFADLSPAQEKILKDLCYQQLSSLRRIYSNNHASDIDIEMFLIENEISKEDFKHDLEVQIERIKQFGVRPDKMDDLTEQELSAFRHILCNVRDDYQKKYPKAMANLWERFFALGGFKTLEKILTS